MDDKLREIILAVLAVNANGEGSGVSVQLIQEGPHEIGTAIAQIKQAFTDDLTNYNFEHYKPTMTGQEWFDRFRKEYRALSLNSYSKDHYAKMAARKASGLDV